MVKGERKVCTRALKATSSFFQSPDILEIQEQKTILICTTELLEKYLAENTSKILSIQQT